MAGRIGLSLWLEDFLRELESVQRLEDAWELAAALLSSNGFDWSIYGFAPSGDKPDDRFQYLQFSRYPEEWIARYHEMGYAENDYSLYHCAKQLTPCPIGVELAPRSLNASEQKVTLETGEFGMRSGIVVPMRGGENQNCGWGAVGMASSLSGKEMRSVLREYGNGLRLAAMLTHERIQKHAVSQRRAEVNLTGRECEVLLWSALGLESEAIGEKLGLSLATVNFHIAKAMKRLGATTRAHAVARAIVQGLIEP
ncbi:MAG: LuxR family transcriptional regulator [Alphaproteobacteria bacterium]|nr:LuxR family transcriptional regulator [Alphaproteobacteria bacterium]